MSDNLLSVYTFLSGQFQTSTDRTKVWYVHLMKITVVCWSWLIPACEKLFFASPPNSILRDVMCSLKMGHGGNLHNQNWQML